MSRARQFARWLIKWVLGSAMVPGHLAQVLTLGFRGGFVLGVPFLIALACWLLWAAAWGFANWPLVMPSEPWTALGLIMAAAQVYTGILAIAVGGALGFYAVWEFTRGQETPNLQLYFRAKQGELVLSPDAGPTEFLKFEVVLENGGPVAAVWYMVQLHAPFLYWMSAGPSGNVAYELLSSHGRRLQPEGPQLHFLPVNPVAGTQERNWRFDRSDHRRDWIITFMSEGAVGCYPEFPLVLCELEVPAIEIARLDGRLESLYKIAGERLPLTQDSATVDVYAPYRATDTPSGRGSHKECGDAGIE